MIIRKLFESRLDAWAKPKGIVIAWENVPFDPPENSIYLRAFLLRAQTDSRDLAGDHRRYQGVFQVSVFAPIGGGAGRAETLAAEIVDLYPKKLPLVGDGLTVWITRPMSIHAAIQDDGSYVVPVSAGYRSEVYL